MATTRRDFLKAIGGLAVPGGSLLAAFRRSPGRGPRRRVAPGHLVELQRLRWRDGDNRGYVWRAWSGPGASFYVRITHGDGQQLWEIFADAECRQRLAAEIFTAPGLPRLVVRHHGVTLTIGASADGWIESQVTRRPGRGDELLAG